MTYKKRLPYRRGIPAFLPAGGRWGGGCLCLLSVLLLAVTSCVKDELHGTPHPDTGKIAVTADWSGRGEGVDIPTEWTVAMGGYTGTETGGTHVPDYLFSPGDYTLAVYNTPRGITITGTTATIAPETKSGGGSFITGTPGWLLTSVQEVTVEADTDYELTAPMRQQVRRLTLVIEPTGDAADRIEGIEGSLNGAAGTLDFATGTYGAASDVALHFTKITEGGDAGKWTATVWLLGVTGGQRLTATLAYIGGNPQDTRLESDLTEVLKDFNSSGTGSFTLSGTMAETPTEAGVEAGITGWEKIDGGGVDAEM